MEKDFMKKTLFVVLMLFLVSSIACMAQNQNNSSYYEASAEKFPAQYSRLIRGDTITFGSYEQDNNKSDGKEKIEWIVLEVQNGGVLLLSKYGLDAKPYNRTDTDVTWETCSLRKWLNNDFFNSAFSDKEKKMILDTSLENPNNREFGTYGGRDTQDHVFLLDIDAYNKYFSNKTAARCSITRYAEANGGAVFSNGFSPWWLRSPSYYQGGAACVHGEGYIDYNANVGNSALAVRPAVWMVYNP